MDALSIKEYIARAKELEVAIFTEKKLMEAHNQLLLSKRRIAPKRKLVIEPSENTRPQPPHLQTQNTFLVIAIVVILILGGRMLFIVSNGNSYLYSDSFPTIKGIMIFFGALAIWEQISKKRRNDEAIRDYEYRQKKYNESLSVYRDEKKKADEEYGEAVRKHNDYLNLRKNEEESIMLPHKKLLVSLEDTLATHYSLDVLFPKYRNLVAVATIDEYLQSGRCSALEGGDGAYNLYEMELRQNIVIGQLSMILDNMEQIKNNQYTLYQELSHTNKLVEDIIFEIRELESLEKLNAYFSSVTAEAATAPTYIHGHIY